MYGVRVHIHLVRIVPLAFRELFASKYGIAHKTGLKCKGGTESLDSAPREPKLVSFGQSFFFTSSIAPLAFWIRSPNLSPA